MNKAHSEYYFFFMAAFGANISSGGRATNAYHTNRMLHSFNAVVPQLEAGLFDR